MTNESNCYEPPIKWIGQKIKLKGRRNDPFNEPIDKAGELYKDYMNQLTEKCRTLTEKYSIIKKEILNETDFGHIKINYKFLTDERSEFRKSIFTHEFGHFLDFLIKINAENWDIGREYRSHIIHSDFNAINILNDDEKKAYFLDETEFKHLAATYIEHLKILFKKTSGDLNLFLEALMTLLEINVHYKSGASINDLKNYIEIISRHFYFNDMKYFFKSIYEDSKANAENIGVRNRWTILKKWMWRELNK